MSNLVDALFALVAAPFAILARGCREVVRGAAARAGRLEKGLNLQRALPDVASLAPSAPVFLSLGPLLILLAASLIAIGDSVLYGLRFGSLLDPRNLLGITAPDDLHIWAVVAWLGTIAVWGAVAWDLSRTTPTSLPYSNLFGGPRRVLDVLAWLALATCLVAAVLFFAWGQQIIETGERDSDLAVLFMALFALISIGAILVASWSAVPGIVAALSAVFAGIALLFGLAYFFFALVVIVLDKAARAVWPFGDHTSIAPDITSTVLGGEPATDALEENMSDKEPDVVVIGRGPLAQFAVESFGPSGRVGERTVFAPDFNGRLQAAASAALTDLWIERRLLALDGDQQVFHVEGPPQDPAWTEHVIRELKRRRPGTEIAVITWLPEADQRGSSPAEVDPVFRRLRNEGVTNALFVLDPLARFALGYGPRVELAALVNTIEGLLSPRADVNGGLPAKATISRLGAGGDVLLAFASNPVGAGKRGTFARVLGANRGRGDMTDLVAQAHDAATRAAFDPGSSTFEAVLPATDRPAFVVQNLPMAPGDTRREEAEYQTAPWVRSNVSRNAVVLTSCTPGLRLPGMVGPYVTSVGILFHPAAAPAQPGSDGTGPEPVKVRVPRPQPSISEVVS